MAANLILLLILFWLTAETSANNCSESNRVRFKIVPTCPENSTIALLKKVQGFRSVEECALVCGLDSNCSVIFRSEDGICYLGNSQQASELISTSNSSIPTVCKVLVKVSNNGDALITTETTVAPVTTTLSQSAATTINAAVQGLGTLASKLVILFDFRQGYTNLVNPAKYAASPHGAVSQNGEGVTFPGGNNNDYIEVDTDGNTLASTYLSHPNSFTFYVRLMRNDPNHQTYHYFHDCSTSALNRGEFSDNGGRLRVVHAFPAAANQNNYQLLRESISNVFLNDNSLQPASVAAVFVGNTLSNFYKDGAFLQTPNPQSSTYSGAPLCLRLGYHSSSSHALRGRFICYAVAKEALTVTELLQLENLCGT